jgi:CysZ protein
MFRALSAYSRSLSVLFRHRLAWFLWFPLIITILVFYGGFSLTSWATKHISDTIDIWIETVDILPDWASVVQDIIYWIIWIVLRIILFFAFTFLGGSVILLMMAPVLTWLSERVSVALEKDVPEFQLTQFMRDLWRAAALAIKNGALQLALSFGCFLIGFIPIVGAVAPFLLIVFNAYFYGYNFMDYSMERKRYSVKESNRFVWRNRYSAISLGSPFALWMLIPFIGPMTAGFVAVFATIAATMEIERLHEAPKTTRPDGLIDET